MQKNFLYLLILFTIYVPLGYAASWADVVKNQKKMIVAQPSAQISDCKVNELPSASTYEQNDPSTLLDNLLKSSHTPERKQIALQLEQTKRPADMDEELFCKIKAAAWNGLYQSYKTEKNLCAGIISLCNAFITCFNSGIPFKAQPVKEFCQLLAHGGMSTFEEIYRNDDLVQKDLLSSVLSEGLELNNEYAIYLVALDAAKNNDLERAFTLFSTLDQETAVKVLAEAKDTEFARAFWGHVFKNSSDEKKWHAAFQLYYLEHSTNPDRADVYLHLAARTGFKAAAAEAFRRGETTQDLPIALKHYLAAADGGHLGAMDRCGGYYSNLAAQSKTSQEYAKYVDLARSYLVKSAKRNPSARIKLALTDDSTSRIIQNLIPLAEDQSFSMQAQALFCLGEAYYKVGSKFDKQEDRWTYYKKAFSALNRSFEKGEKDAARLLALLEADKAQITPVKDRRRAYSHAKSLLHIQLEQTPDSSELLLALGILEISCGDKEKGIPLILRAHELDPTNEELHSKLNDLFSLLKNRKLYTLSSDIANRLLTINPNCSPAYVALGILAITTGDDLPSALNYFEKAHSTGKPNPEVIFKIAHAHIGLGQQEKSFAVLNENLEFLNDDCFALLASFWHKGTCWPCDLNRAHAFYRAAAGVTTDQYKKQTYLQLAHLALVQKSDFLASELTKPDFAAAVRSLLDNLTIIINTTHEPGVQNEARLALAIQSIYIAHLYKEPKKKKDLFFKAVNQLTTILGTEPHLRAAFLKAETLRGMMTEGLLDPRDIYLVATIEPMFKELIEALEKNEPQNQLLTDSYNSLGLYYAINTTTPELALPLFLKGAQRNSTESCLNLYNYFRVLKNYGQAVLWAQKAHDLDPTSPVVQKAIGFVNELMQQVQAGVVSGE